MTGFRVMECQKLAQAAKCFFCWECCFHLGDLQSENFGNLCLLMAMALSFFVFLIPEMDPITRALPCCRTENNTLAGVGENMSGAVTVLRLSLVYVLYFLVTLLIAITTRKHEESLNFFRRGFWLLKAGILSIGCFASTYIKPRQFDKAWTIFLALGSMMFILIQMYTLIRLSYVVIITLHNMEESGSRAAHRAQVGLFISGVVLSVVGEALLIYYYPLCSANVVFLIINAVIPFIACLWSVSDCVRARNGHSSFIQGSILSFLVIVYTWSALTNNPSRKCNPYFGKGSFVSVSHVLSVIYAFAIYIINTNFSYLIYVDDLEDLSSRREESRSSARCRSESIDGGATQYRTRVYNSLFCNFLRAPLICFIVMTIMHWSPPTANADLYKTNRTAMWYKLVSCWLSIIFFVITLYTPSVYGITKKKRLLDKP